MTRQMWMDDVYEYLDVKEKDVIHRDQVDLEVLYKEGWTPEAAAGIAKLAWRKTVVH